MTCIYDMHTYVTLYIHIHAGGAFSPEQRFFVPPVAGTQPSPTEPTRIILYDDLGRGSTDDTYTWNEYGRPSVYTMQAVGYEVAQGGVHAIYHGGDISYATGYEAVWDFFMDMISPVASSVLYITTVGNHESDWPGRNKKHEQ
jgi:acid phosphatase type 7